MTAVRRTASSVLAVLVALAASPAAAAGEESAGRYTMSPTEGGVIRLDRETGAMSFCTGKEGEWRCTPMADSQSKLEDEIKRLEAENRALKDKAEPTAPDLPPGDDLDPAPPEGVPQGTMPVPTEKDVDRLFDYIEGMVKKFRERIEQLEKKTEPQTPL